MIFEKFFLEFGIVVLRMVIYCNFYGFNIGRLSVLNFNKIKLD